MKCIFLLASYKAWNDQEDLPTVACVIFFLEWDSLPSKISGSDAIVHREENWPSASGNTVTISQLMKICQKREFWTKIQNESLLFFGVVATFV